MTETQTERDWLQVGATVVVITFNPGSSYPTASRDTVSVLTRTQVGLSSSTARRYSRDTLKSRGDSAYGPHSYLVALDDPEAARLFLRQGRRILVNQVTQALKDWSQSADSLDEEGYTEALAILGRWRTLRDKHKPNATKVKALEGVKV